MITIAVKKGRHYTFYLVDKCHNWEDSPYGKDTICIPVQGMRTNCAMHSCDLCELSGKDKSCHSPYEEQPRALELFGLYNLRDTRPELFI